MNYTITLQLCFNAAFNSAFALFSICNRKNMSDDLFIEKSEWRKFGDYEHLTHNILFPNTRYSFIGISEDACGARFILQQPYLSDKYVAPSQNDIDAYLIQGLGLHIENRYYYANDYIAITDVLSCTVGVVPPYPTCGYGGCTGIYYYTILISLLYLFSTLRPLRM